MDMDREVNKFVGPDLELMGSSDIGRYFVGTGIGSRIVCLHLLHQEGVWSPLERFPHDDPLRKVLQMGVETIIGNRFFIEGDSEMQADDVQDVLNDPCHFHCLFDQLPFLLRIHEMKSDGCRFIGCHHDTGVFRDEFQPDFAELVFPSIELLHFEGQRVGQNDPFLCPLDGVMDVVGKRQVDVCLEDMIQPCLGLLDKIKNGI